MQKAPLVPLLSTSGLAVVSGLLSVVVSMCIYLLQIIFSRGILGAVWQKH